MHKEKHSILYGEEQVICLVVTTQNIAFTDEVC